MEEEDIKDRDMISEEGWNEEVTRIIGERIMGESEEDKEEEEGIERSGR